MFSIFGKRNDKKLRHDADNWLRLADKVYHYRRDLLSDKELNELGQASLELRELLKSKESESSRIKLAVERLEDVIRRVGGSYYPKSAWAENVEVLLVAAILAIGIRTYFIQPFKIPTNSMKPTYYGMTAEVYADPDEEPGSVRSVARTLFFGASRVDLDAENNGICRLPIIMDPASGGFDFIHQEVPDRTWLVFPTVSNEYTVFVGDRPHTYRVPRDFQQQVRDIILEVFYPEHESLVDAVTEMRQTGRYRHVGNNRYLIETDREVDSGDRIVSFDILTGDQLFVDRMSYHFKRPDVGESIVFRTGDIPGLGNQDSYYIKRLVGSGGDRLEIREPYLYRNGEPIDSRDVFKEIHGREGKYGGYVALGNLEPDAYVRVEDGMYYALGDNSGNSMDSRNFGFIPEHAVVGRPIMIYYPFTTRWGRAR